MDASFATLLEAVAARIPDAVALTEPGREHAYAEFENRAARLAAALDAAGVRAGDRVACFQHNGSAYLETVFAALKIGAVPVNVNYRYTAQELASLLIDADAAGLVFSGALSGVVAAAAGQVPTLRILVRVGPPVAGKPGPDCPELDDLLGATAARPAAPRPGTDRLFLYTGGTTGAPKGAIWQQSDLVQNLLNSALRPLGITPGPSTVDEVADNAARLRAGGRSPVTLPVVPFMHGTGLFNSIGALLVGGRVVTIPAGRLDPRVVWTTVATQRVSTILVAGNAVCQPLVDELVRAEEAGSAYDLSSLRGVLSSGTAFSDRLKHALHERADITVTDAIASSEGGPYAFGVTTSVGDLPTRFHPTSDTMVIDPDDREVRAGSGEIGMLAFAGPQALGYHKDAGTAATTFRVIAGRHYTVPGDLAELEADGAIRFLGRGSGVINTGGEKVHPKEVEDALLTHPGVTDCVVLGVPDETWGERVTAIVAAPATTSPLELQDRVRSELAGYKVPRTVVVIDALPRTPSGKLELAWARRTVEQRLAAGGTTGSARG